MFSLSSPSALRSQAPKQLRWAFWGNMLIPAPVCGGTIEIWRGRGTMGMRRKNVKWCGVNWCSVNCLKSFYHHWCISRDCQGSGQKVHSGKDIWVLLMIFSTSVKVIPSACQKDNCPLAFNWFKSLCLLYKPYTGNILILYCQSGPS